MTAGIVPHPAGGALGDDLPGLEAVDPVADAHDERHVVLDEEHRRGRVVLDAANSGPKASVSRWATTGRGLVQAEHRGARASRPASSTTRRVPVERSLT